MVPVDVPEAGDCKRVLHAPGNGFLLGALQSYSRSGQPIFKQCVQVRHQKILKSFTKLSTTPENVREADQQRIVHLVMSRVLHHEHPLKVLSLFDDPGEKLTKYAVQLYGRICAFKLRYEAQPHVRKPNGQVVVCGYCYELLTCFATGKRPSWFGWFLDTERLEHRCFKDDSDQLNLISLSNIRMSITMPDRPRVISCLQCGELSANDLCQSCSWQPVTTTDTTVERPSKEARKRSAFLKSLEYEQRKVEKARLIK